MNSLSPAFSSSTLLMNDALIFVPKLVMALVILAIGFFIAKALKKVSMRAMTRLLSAKVLDDTPVDEFLEGADMKKRLDQIVGSAVFWLVLLFTLYLMAGVLGFTSLTYFLSQLFSYVPNIISAAVVLIIGVLLAGFLETFIKGSMSGLGASTARLIAKVTSYVVIVLAGLIALSELGIAREFILILFIGFTAALALAIGLAVGLGGQHMVRQLFDRWYHRVEELEKQQDVKSK